MSLRYAPELSPSLQDINIVVQPGSKVRFLHIVSVFVIGTKCCNLRLNAIRCFVSEFYV